jgi:hypothetical protein
MRTHLLPFALGAFATSVALGACDRTIDTAQAAETPPGAPAVKPEAPDATSAAAINAIPRAPLTDAVITNQVKSAIVNDPHLAGADISVNTDRGVVVLSGLVATPEQIAIASSYAQRQDGVMRVDNHLATAPQ